MELVLTAIVVVAAPAYVRFVWGRFVRTPMGRLKRAIAFSFGVVLALLGAIVGGQFNLLLALGLGAMGGVESLEMFAYNSDGGPENQLRLLVRALRRAAHFGYATFGRR